LETTRLIQVALDQLPTHYGDALEWKYVYGFSVDEIAEKLGIGFEAAQSLLARAKRAFQEIYGALTIELRSNPGRGGPKTAAELP
jgi:RNA polymerase sigma-70 factor (ECF subfamily)